MTHNVDLKFRNSAMKLKNVIKSSCKVKKFCIDVDVTYT